MRCALFLIHLTVFSLLPIKSVIAQDNVAFEQGVKPYGSYHGGDIDSISMANVQPTIHIPLISYPQRGGKLKVDFSVALTTPYAKPFANCYMYCTPLKLDTCQV